MFCEKCKAELHYAYNYDSLYCVACDEWLEEKCDDSHCEYCAERPERPSLISEFYPEGEQAMLTTRFLDAFELAMTAHDLQYRKNTTIPYISHLMAVSALVLEYGGDEDQAIAALLHDALENGGAEFDQIIRQKFGHRVYSIVQDCTDGLPDETGQKSDWYPRKRKFLANLVSMPSDSLLVIAADKLHNIRSILQDFQMVGDEVFDRFSTHKDGTLWYYNQVIDVLSKNFTSPITQQLQSTVEALNKI
jgi:(p)ppGpp synthase/HD superfamily hydrolase